MVCSADSGQGNGYAFVNFTEPQAAKAPRARAPAFRPTSRAGSSTDLVNGPFHTTLFWSNYFISAWFATIPLHHGIMAWHHGMDEGTKT